MNVTTVRLISVTKRVDNSNDPDRTAHIAANVSVTENRSMRIQDGRLTHPDRPGAACVFRREEGTTNIDFQGYDTLEDQIAVHTLINDFITSVASSELSALEA